MSLSVNSIPAHISATLADFLDAGEIVCTSRSCRTFYVALASPSNSASRCLKIPHLSWRLTKQIDLVAERIDISDVCSAELPPQLVFLPSGSAELHHLPAETVIRWHVPTSLDTLGDLDLLEEDDEPSKLLGHNQGICVQEGALRSVVFSVPARSSQRSLNVYAQLRWFPEGGPLCAREEGGCSFYLICEPGGSSSDMNFTATFELFVGSLRRIFCHDFSTCPQWGCADFGNLLDAGNIESNRIHIGVKFLETPACFRIESPSPSVNLTNARLSVMHNNRKAWCLECWSRKQTFGPAAYASPPLDLFSCRAARLLVAVGADNTDDLVDPRTKASRSVVSEPLSAFVGAPPGEALRFTIAVGRRRLLFFHRFSFTAGFAGTRRLVEHADEACLKDEIKIEVEILGNAPLGDELDPELLPGL